jgi:sulfate transport system permease protein
MIPGRPLSIGVTLFGVTLVVLLPIVAILGGLQGISPGAFVQAVTTPRVLAAYRLTFGASFCAALVDGLIGLLIAWVLVRYRFLGRALLNASIDLPFALPTAVSGIALASLYADNGWIGSLTSRLGIHIAFTQAGVTIALVFVGLPFVVRTLQPALEALPPELEQASSILGASDLQTLLRVVLPILSPAWLAGFGMAFARGLGEYGSVIFIAGNRPGLTEIVPLVIISKLEQYDYTGATALAATMLLVSFALLLAINALRRRIIGQQVAL